MSGERCELTTVGFCFAITIVHKDYRQKDHGQGQESRRNKPSADTSRGGFVDCQ